MQMQEVNPQSLYFQATVLFPELQGQVLICCAGHYSSGIPFYPEVRLSLIGQAFPWKLPRLARSADTVFFLLSSTNECFHEHPLDNQ